MNHKFPHKGIHKEGFYYCVQRISPGSSKRWICGRLLTFSYSVVLKARKWTISSCFSRLLSYSSLLFTIHYRKIATAKSPNFLYRITLWQWKMPITLPWGSNAFWACRPLCRRHIFFSRPLCWIKFSVILFFFYFPNNQPHKKSQFCIYSHFRSMLLSGQSTVIYYHFPTMLKECHTGIFFSHLDWDDSISFFDSQLLPGTQRVPLSKLSPTIPNPSKNSCLSTWPRIILQFKLGLFPPKPSSVFG